MIALLHAARSRVRQGGVQARRLRPHQRRRRRGLAELDRHRAAPLRRVPRPRRRVRAPRHHRARQGHPHGTPRGSVAVTRCRRKRLVQDVPASRAPGAHAVLALEAQPRGGDRRPGAPGPGGRPGAEAGRRLLAPGGRVPAGDRSLPGPLARVRRGRTRRSSSRSARASSPIRSPRRRSRARSRRSAASTASSSRRARSSPAGRSPRTGAWPPSTCATRPTRERSTRRTARR